MDVLKPAMYVRSTGRNRRRPFAIGVHGLVRPNVRVHRSAACGASGATRGWTTFYSFLELRPATCGVLGLPLLVIELGDHQFLNGPSVKAPSVDTEAVRV